MMKHIYFVALVRVPGLAIYAKDKAQNVFTSLLCLFFAHEEAPVAAMLVEVLKNLT